MPVRAIAAAFAVVISVAVGAQEHEHRAPADAPLGIVSFTTSCAPPVAPQFNRAVALLHSFEFSRAIAAFRETLSADPSCALADWGVAIALWGNPFVVGARSAAVLRQGHDAAAAALGLKPPTERERAYVDAVSRLYDRTDAIDQRTRLVAYRDAMAALAAAHPADTEASIFYALSIAAVAAASPPDPSYAEPLKAGAILEGLFVAQPGHPGLAHYIIHSYDYPPLADRALEAARRYATIAPDAPHARHMPSHTFTRVGSWQESIDANVASGEIARRDGSVGEELHAMDYRAYAYLQTGQDERARALVDALPEVAARFSPDAPQSAAPPSAALFAVAAIPARYALERGAWAEAARLVPRSTDYPYTEALTHTARALGAAHTGDAAAVRASIAALQRITAALTAKGESYSAEQTDIQGREAVASLAFVDGRTGDAIAGLREAATVEDATEKSAVTPGPLAPARELLGDMLLQLGQPAAALIEFEATLKKEPNRFRALYGAARSAALAADRRKARSYYEQLLKMCESADAPGRPELRDARAYLQASARRAPDVHDDFAHLAEGYTSAFAGGPVEAGYRMFSAPDFGEMCAQARADAVKSLRPAAATIDARVGVPIPYDRLKVDALDARGVLVGKVPIAIEAYRWSEILDTRNDRIAEDTVTPREPGTIRLRVRTLCEGPGGETFVTINVSR